MKDAAAVHIGCIVEAGTVSDSADVEHVSVAPIVPIVGAAFVAVARGAALVGVAVLEGVAPLVAAATVVVGSFLEALVPGSPTVVVPTFVVRVAVALSVIV